jgi:hypothetical protein
MLFEVRGGQPIVIKEVRSGSDICRVNEALLGCRKQLFNKEGKVVKASSKMTWNARIED